MICSDMPNYFILYSSLLCGTLSKAFAKSIIIKSVKLISLVHFLLSIVCKVQKGGGLPLLNFIWLKFFICGSPGATTRNLLTFVPDLYEVMWIRPVANFADFKSEKCINIVRFNCSNNIGLDKISHNAESRRAHGVRNTCRIYTLQLGILWYLWFLFWQLWCSWNFYRWHQWTCFLRYNRIKCCCNLLW